MKLRLITGFACSWMLVASSAMADTVVLSDGETIDGIVRDKGDHIEIELDFGTMSIERSQVKEIKKAPTKLAELRARRAKITEKNAGQLFELAKWANQEGLATQARALCREVVQIAPDHAGARQMLGQQKHEGRWLNEAEYMTATGHVQYRGRWLPAEEAARLESEERQARVEAKERQRLVELETQVDRARFEAAEARAEAERARQSAERSQSSYWWSGGYGYWPGYSYPYRPGYGPKPELRPDVKPTPKPLPGQPVLLPVQPAAPKSGARASNRVVH